MFFDPESILDREKLSNTYALAKFNLVVPLYTSVAAGFPSPADDYQDETLDVGKYLVRNPDATYFIHVRGDSMIGAGMFDGDILVVDRSRHARHGNIVVAVLNREFTVKRLHHHRGRVELRAENPAYPNLPVSADDDFQIWGVVCHVLHKTV